MGQLQFFLPDDLTSGAAKALERSYFMSGVEYVPWPSEAKLEDHRLSVRTVVDESGCLCAPWEVGERGRLLLATATLARREEPYRLLVELARGTVNHLRNQAAEWESGGLVIPADLAGKMLETNRLFATVACRADAPAEAEKQATKVLAHALESGEELVREYVQQVIKARLTRQDRLNATLGVRLDGPPPDPAATAVLKQSFNAIQLPLSWPRVETVESQYDWSTYDALVAWGKENGFQLAAGPLIDFSPSGLPSWLGTGVVDVRRLANFMDDYVEMAIERYRDRIGTWQLTGATNWPVLLGIPRDDLFRLAARLFETASQIDPNLVLIMGIAQPWGEYLAGWGEGSFPFSFADTMLRNHVRLAGLDVELIVGVEGRGSMKRDLLEVSRLLDFYALLGLPVHVTLGCPSAEGPDGLALDPNAVAPFGDAASWDPRRQAECTRRLAPLALCKPYVDGVSWTHWSDGVPHRFPHCGLVDAQGNVKPALAELRALRESHLR